MKAKLKLVLMFGLILTAAFCYAHHMARTADMKENERETPIIVIKNTTYGGLDKSSSIQASINGHTLSVVFTENLGEVQIEVTDATGGTVDYWDLWTPNGYIAYLYDTGSYVVNFTLSNGEEYYGEFEVTE